VDKRDGSWTCWEAADGQIHCIPKRSILEKRQGDWHCWETADGQIECDVGKRDNLIDLSKREICYCQGDWCCWETADGMIDCVVCHNKDKLAKRSGEWKCWEAADGQIHCTVNKRQDVQMIHERDMTKRQGGWCCWETSDGQIDCVVCKSKRDDVHEIAPVQDTIEPVCYHHGEDDIYCLNEKRGDGKSMVFPCFFCCPSSLRLSRMLYTAIYISPTPIVA